MKKILFFGNKEECKHCKILFLLLKNKNFNFDDQNFQFIDAFADQQQQYCDEHLVDAIPHIKIIQNNKKLFQVFGEQINYKQLVEVMIKTLEDNRK